MSLMCMDFPAPGLASPSFVPLPGFLPFKAELKLNSFLLGTFPCPLATSQSITGSQPQAVTTSRQKQVGAFLTPKAGGRP